MLTMQNADVYCCTMAFIELTSRMAGQVPQDQVHLADQLRRAALSIPLIIGDGGGHAAARGSALACAAIVDVLDTLRFVVAEQAREARDLLDCIAAKLWPSAGEEAGYRASQPPSTAST
jgi:hypothetical protein